MWRLSEQKVHFLFFVFFKSSRWDWITASWRIPLKLVCPSSCSEQPQLDLVSQGFVQSCLDTFKDDGSTVPLGTHALSEQPCGDNLFFLSSSDFSWVWCHLSFCHRAPLKRVSLRLLYSLPTGSWSYQSGPPLSLHSWHRPEAAPSACPYMPQLFTNPKTLCWAHTTLISGFSGMGRPGRDTAVQMQSPKGQIREEGVFFWFIGIFHCCLLPTLEKDSQWSS